VAGLVRPRVVFPRHRPLLPLVISPSTPEELQLVEEATLARDVLECAERARQNQERRRRRRPITRATVKRRAVRQRMLARLRRRWLQQ
jgi:hypothetical protein